MTLETWHCFVSKFSAATTNQWLPNILCNFQLITANSNGDMQLRAKRPQCCSVSSNVLYINKTAGYCRNFPVISHQFHTVYQQWLYICLFLYLLIFIDLISWKWNVILRAFGHIILPLSSKTLVRSSNWTVVMQTLWLVVLFAPFLSKNLWSLVPGKQWFYQEINSSFSFHSMQLVYTMCKATIRFLALHLLCSIIDVTGWVYSDH